MSGAKDMQIIDTRPSQAEIEAQRQARIQLERQRLAQIQQEVETNKQRYQQKLAENEQRHRKVVAALDAATEKTLQQNQQKQDSEMARLDAEIEALRNQLAQEEREYEESRQILAALPKISDANFVLLSNLEAPMKAAGMKLSAINMIDGDVSIRFDHLSIDEPIKVDMQIEDHAKFTMHIDENSKCENIVGTLQHQFTQRGRELKWLNQANRQEKTINKPIPEGSDSIKTPQRQKNKVGK